MACPGPCASARAGGNAFTETLVAYALYQIIVILLDVLWWIIIIRAIMSWLIAFNVVNMGNDFVRTVMVALDRTVSAGPEPFAADAEALVASVVDGGADAMLMSPGLIKQCGHVAAFRGRGRRYPEAIAALPLLQQGCPQAGRARRSAHPLQG